jgi:hypothetical protein
MPRKPKSIIAHLRIRSSNLDNFLQFETKIHEKTTPNPVTTTGRTGFDVYDDDKTKDTKVDSLDGTYRCNKEHINMNIHPRKTNSVCWWDGYLFNTKPCYIPKTKMPDGTYSIYGNFCSPECAKAYLENDPDLSPEIRWERSILLQEMTQKTYNKDIVKIKEAPPRWTLKDYGGEFTIEQFRKLNTLPSAECEFFYPPITTDIPIVRVKNSTIKPPNNVSDKVIIQEERFRKAEKNLMKKQKEEKIDTVKRSIIKKPTGGLASMMNIKVVEPTAIST